MPERVQKTHLVGQDFMHEEPHRIITRCGLEGWLVIPGGITFEDANGNRFAAEIKINSPIVDCGQCNMAVPVQPIPNCDLFPGCGCKTQGHKIEGVTHTLRRKCAVPFRE